MKIRTNFLFFFLFFVINAISYGSIIDNTTVGFTRSLKGKGTIETTEGTLYCKNSEDIVVSIHKPVKQWISFENNVIRIYYPEDSIAFKIISDYPSSFSFFNTFLSVAKEDFGLSDRGYTLSDHEIKEDTLITYWSPSGKLCKTVENLKLIYVNNRIISSEIKKMDGEFILKSSYEKHLDYGGCSFPMEINTMILMDGDTVFEKILYRNLKSGDSLPEEIKNFKIPEDIETREVRW